MSKSTDTPDAATFRNIRLKSSWDSILRPHPSLWKEILAIASPVVGAMLFQALVNQADSIMVGRLPAADGVPGQAAIGLTVKILWAIGGFLSAISVGTQAVTARRIGEHDPDGAGAALTNSLIVATVTSLVAAVLGSFYGPQLLHLVSDGDPEVMRVGGPFIRVRLLGIFTMVTTISYKAFFDGLGKTYVHFVASLLMNITNIVLNYMFIYGEWGAPYLGVMGAALASVLSTVVGLGVMVYYSLKPEFRRKYRYYTLSKISGGLAWLVARLSLPSGFATLLLMVGFLIVDWVVGGLATGHRATVYQAANQIIITILMPALMTCVAFGTATATLVSRSLGEKNPDMAELYGWESARLWAAIMLVLGLWMGLYPEFWVRLFNPNSPEVVAAASGPLGLVGYLLPLAAVGMVLMQAHFGAGNTLFVMYVEFGAQFGVLIPLSIYLGRYMKLGLMGVWGPTVLYLFTVVAFMTVTFYRGRWKLIKI